MINSDLYERDPENGSLQVGDVVSYNLKLYYCCPKSSNVCLYHTLSHSKQNKHKVKTVGRSKVQRYVLNTRSLLSTKQGSLDPQLKHDVLERSNDDNLICSLDLRKELELLDKYNLYFRK